MSHEVVCIGNTFAEFLVYGFADMPPTAQATSAEQLLMFAGGMAVNTAYSLGKLGTRSAVISKLGTGKTSEGIIGLLKGVDHSCFMRSHDVETPRIVTLVSRDSSRERRFIVVQHHSSLLRLSDLRTKRSILETAKLIHFGDVGNIPAVEEAEVVGFLRDLKSKNKDLVITADIAALDRIKDERVQKSLIPFLSTLDYFLPSNVEAAMLTGMELDDYEEAAAVLHKRYRVRNVCIKLADQGVYASFDRAIDTVAGNSKIIDPFWVNEIKDRTGCGDAWCAGFIHGLLNKQDPVTCLALGNACASICIRHKGPNGFPVSIDQLRELTRSRTA
ncbi:MAG: carbohydrate kinase family protein [Phycisphaerales bacterium]